MLSSSVPPYRLALLCILAACGSDPTAPTTPVTPTPPPVPAPFDLRFKGIGMLTGKLAGFANLLSPTLQVWTNQIGSPLALSACAPPTPSRTNCSWDFAMFDEPVGTPDVSTINNGAGRVSSLDADLAAMQNGTFVLPLGQPPRDGTSVVTSLFVDEASDVYATSALQSSDVRDFPLVSGTVAGSALQAAATQAGAAGRVITALAFRGGGNVVYLSYGWTRDTTPAYEARTVATPFAGVAAAATSLAGEGYVITAVGGDAAHGYLLVGTRPRGVTAPRPVRIETDSVWIVPHDDPAVPLVNAGYAIVGALLDGVRSDGGGPFHFYIGEK